MIQRIFLTFLIVFLAAIAPKPSFATIVCSSTTPAFYFRSETAQTRYVQNQSADILTQIHGATKGATQGSTVGGLGGGEIGFKTESSFEIFKQRGEACVILKSVTITLYTKPKIQIANNYKPATCEYNAVMEHEREHVSILLAFAREYESKTKTYISNALRSMKPVIGPIHVSQIDKAQDAIQNALQGRIQIYSDQIMPVLIKRQDAFDNPREYASVTAKCRNWGAKPGR